MARDIYMDIQFDVSRVMSTIGEICDVSEFMLPDDLASSGGMEGYLRRARRRLAVVSGKFEQLGYTTIAEEFDFRGVKATNALFVNGDISDGSILFTAHHDYCAGLGAEDNATALAIMLELGRCLEREETSVLFASFDLEEIGLSGSRHFVKSATAERLRPLSGVIALECLGSGKDVVVCTAVLGAKSDPGLVEGLFRSGKKLGHKILLESFDWFNSDHVPFAELGVKTAEVCSFNSEHYKGGPAPNVNVAHSRLDVPASIRPETLEVVGEVLLQFIHDL